MTKIMFVGECNHVASLPLNIVLTKFLTKFIYPEMSVMIILIIASILVAGGFLIAFLASAKNGQFDDEYGPPVRMLFDDTPKENS